MNFISTRSGGSADLVGALIAARCLAGKLIRDRAHDSISLGVSHQSRARELADKFGYVEPGLWTGVGRARSGCGAALVGSTDQVMSKIESYQKMGIRASATRELVYYFNHMNTMQWGIVSACAVGFGFLCLKGTGVNR